jgi:hypothetical protein
MASLMVIFILLFMATLSNAVTERQTRRDSLRESREPIIEHINSMGSKPNVVTREEWDRARRNFSPPRRR